MSSPVLVVWQQQYVRTFARPLGSVSSSNSSKFTQAWFLPLSLSSRPSLGNVCVGRRWSCALLLTAPFAPCWTFCSSRGISILSHPFSHTSCASLLRFLSFALVCMLTCMLPCASSDVLPPTHPIIGCVTMRCKQSVSCSRLVCSYGNSYLQTTTSSYFLV